jgi:microcystin-dependent protein
MSLSITKLYADNTELTEAHLDAMKESIETYINVTGLTGDNIQDNSITSAELQTSSVTESKIAANAVVTTKILDGAVTMAKLAAALQAYLVPTATELLYAGDTAPAGFLMCDGTAVSRTTYASLFAVIGVRHGSGDGTTTFNVPDARGRFVRFTDGTAGRDPDSGSRTAMNTGGATGNNVGSVQEDEFESHSHSYSTFEQPNGALGTGASRGINGAGSTNTAANGGNETRPKNFYTNLIIKT